MSVETGLRVGARVADTRAEGPFRRYALWVRGCSLRCPGCCNPELFEAAGPLTALAELKEELAAARARGVEGLTVLGGEPAEQAEGVAALGQAARALGLGVIVFSGFTLEELRARREGAALLATIDTLVDGPFEAGSRGPRRRWIGSPNQRVIHLTPRYADPSLWVGGDHAEVAVGPGGELEVHGAPAVVRRLARALAAGRH